MKKIYSATILLLLYGFTIWQNDFSEKVYKKIDKTITKLWPDKQVKRTAINVTSNELGFQVNPNSLFKLTDENKKIIGYAFLDKANSKSAKFDFVVFFDENLKIKFTQVLVYREDYGGEIGSNRWLKQFNGKYNGRNMTFQKDIQNISGATISSRNITNAIKKLSQRIVVLQQKGFLN